MSSGVSTFLLVVGATLVFAVDFTLIGLDIPVLGIILMAAGALGIALSLGGYFARERRRDQQSYWYDRYD